MKFSIKLVFRHQKTTTGYGVGTIFFTDFLHGFIFRMVILAKLVRDVKLINLHKIEKTCHLHSNCQVQRTTYILKKPFLRK